MSDINKVILKGNLGNDPQAIKDSSEQLVGVALSIATKSFGKKGEDGKRNEYTNWHQIKIWNNQKESCLSELSSGDNILVVGEIITESWEDENQNKKYNTTIRANSVDFIKLKKWNENKKSD